MTVITLDGPSGSGKSTIAREIALRLHLPFLDTGAMYRAVGLLAIEKGVAFDDEAGLVTLATDMELQIIDDRVEGKIHCRFELFGRDVTSDIRTVEASHAASAIAVHPLLRERLVLRQRNWVEAHEGGVAEGRDIGTVVFPNADLKIFLTANEQERIKRRQSDKHAPAFSQLSSSEVEKQMAERDKRDSTRSASPLVPAPDAIIIDTSGRSIDDIVTEIMVELRKRFDGELPMGEL